MDAGMLAVAALAATISWGVIGITFQPTTAGTLNPMNIRGATPTVPTPVLAAPTRIPVSVGAGVRSVDVEFSHASSLGDFLAFFPAWTATTPPIPHKGLRGFLDKCKSRIKRSFWTAAQMVIGYARSLQR
jgi:hypothetical protein